MKDISEVELVPGSEGRTHIRIGLPSRSPLGRLLANEAHTPFEHPKFGKFESLEGYWAYIACGSARNPLRAMPGVRDVYGIAAQRLTLITDKRHNPDFRNLICEGLSAKIEQNEELARLLKDNNLPLVRYEIFDGDAVLNTGQKWFLDHLSTIAQRLKCPTRRRT